MRIAIVGLGPAGSMFAAMASGLGLNVDAFDSAGEYRKACGDALTIRKEYDKLVEESGAVETVVRNFEIQVESRPTATISMSRPAWKIINKGGLVGYLREIARANGARIFLNSPQRIERLKTDYDIIVDARGPFTTPPSKGEHVLVYRAIVRVNTWDPETALLDFEPSRLGLYWAFPASDDGRLVNVGAGYYGMSVEYARNETLSRARRELGPLEIVDERGSLIHVWGPVSLHSDGIVRIGEAAGLINAVGGEGNRMALLSALKLAEAVSKGGSYSPYHLYEKLASPLVAEAKLTKILLSMVATAHPAIASAALESLPKWFWEKFLRGRLDLRSILELMACCPTSIGLLLSRSKTISR